MWFKVIFKLLCLFVFAGGVQPAVASESEQLKEAVTSYYQGDHNQAGQVFETLLEDYPESGALWYNLGNTHFKQGELGLAIQSYLKAKRLIPRHAGLKTNLQSAFSKRVDVVEPGLWTSFIDTMFFWRGFLTGQEVQLICVVVGLMFWLGLFWRFIRKRALLPVPLILILVLYAYVIGGYFLKAYEETPGRYAVVVANQVAVKASYLQSEQALFTLHEGTLVEVVGEQELDGLRWFRVALPGGEKGWVLETSIGVI